MSAIAAFETLAETIGLKPGKRLKKGALVALETVQPVSVTKYGVQVMFGLDSERTLETWKDECKDGIPFPEPVVITDRLQRWDVQELLDWWEKKKAKRNQRSPF